MSQNDNGQEWLAYYEQFPYFTSEKIRPGSHPKIFEHEGEVEKSIVLVHGLTDSPYFMLDLARHFHFELKYNVYVPLLQCHGLKNPEGMDGVNLQEWKKNVEFAIDVASSKTQEVSIGGLSTGGTLSFIMAAKNSQINGALYLFSAALDLAGGIWGQFKEKLLRTPVAKMMDRQERKRSLIGKNPYRYARMDKGGARQLALLIKEVDGFLLKGAPRTVFSRPAFAAHSDSDTTTAVTGITKLFDYFEPGKLVFFRIQKEKCVPHASLVLKEPIYAKDAASEEEPLEIANCIFDEMIEAINAFSDGKH